MGKGFWLFAGGAVAGAAAAAFLLQNRGKTKPMAAKILAKAFNLKQKALSYAARTREQVEDIVAEAKQINDASTPENRKA
jgi:hypothetical protein